MGDRERLLEILKKRSLTFGDTKLTSGRDSNYYVDARLTTLDPEGARLVASVFLEMAGEVEADAVGGPTLGADPIVGAMVALSHIKGKSLPGFLVRKEAKKHGRMRLIEGGLKPGAKVIIVEDVVTTGGSVLKAVKAVEDAGCKVVKILAILDRCEGAADEFRSRGYDFSAIFTRDDVLGKGLAP